MGMLAAGTDDGHIGIVVIHLGSLGLQLFDKNVAGTFPVVIDIGLVGQAQKQDF